MFICLGFFEEQEEHEEDVLAVTEAGVGILIRQNNDPLRICLLFSLEYDKW